MPAALRDRTAGTGFDSAFPRAVARLAEDGPITVLFSGGLDSSLIAWELREREGTVLWSVGQEGSSDLAAARSAAEMMDLAWQHATLTGADVEAALERFVVELQDAEGPPLDVAVAFALALDRAPTTRVLAGQGADELFLGYAHFRGLTEEQAARRVDADLKRLLDLEWPRAQRIAERAGHLLVAPFLEPDVVRAALEIPLAERMPGDVPKQWLRGWAIARGLAPEIASRPKRAIQYGSRVQRLLRELRPPSRSR
ncbi:asparagine synthase (glutamine-hydrolyzing) [mine drainage metagenome]|uniref:Asparagine synthase (Glutamine-hydrolyzing) n=1 Tax=mine drainage metagenome TaxID=410659 RepID=T1BKM3_9ZZZZ